MNLATVLILSLLCCGHVAAADLYAADSSWAPAFPIGAHQFSAVDVANCPSSNDRCIYVTQRGNTSLPSVVVVSTAATNEVVTSWGTAPEIAVDATKHAYGSHGLAVESCPGALQRVYIDDFTGHTLTAYSPTGSVLSVVGTPGIAGNGTAPLQFGNVADTAVVCGDNMTNLYVSDGDGGSANRVLKLAVPPAKFCTTDSDCVAGDSYCMKDPTKKAPFVCHSDPPSLVWHTPAGTYRNPHSIAHHAASDLLLLADREHNQTKLLLASDGTDLGAFNCGINYGPSGGGAKPFGVRTLVLKDRGLDLGFVAMMDNPQDGGNQRIAVLDLSGLQSELGVRSPCRVVQNIPIPTTVSGPHLLGIDTISGDVYAALVSDTPKSTVLRFRLV